MELVAKTTKPTPIMGLLSLFTRSGPPAPPAYLLSYTFCYQGLPKIFFANPAAVLSALQKDPSTALQEYLSTFLQDYVKAMPAALPHIPKDFNSLFSAEVRPVDANLSTVLITHPRPPKQPVELQPGKPILAPYFTAILFDPSSLAMKSYFVLGQNLTGGTTLRSVSGEGSHGNCGTGCNPQLEEFLSLLVLLEREGIEAVWRLYPQG